MTTRTQIIVIGCAAAVVLVLLAVTFYANGLSITNARTGQDNGTPLQPEARRAAEPSYVIAELYQDVSLDIASGVYNPNGRLMDSAWTHEPETQTCRVDLVLALQRARTEAPPTATARPTHTPPPTDAPQNPEEYQVVERQSANGNGIALVLVPTPRSGWPTSTARPTYTPIPTPKPAPLLSSVSWSGWHDRPLEIQTDGQAVMSVPREAEASAYLSLWTGTDQAAQTQLARLPLPGPIWAKGKVYLDLKGASGRVLLSRNVIPTNHRTTRLHVAVSPLSDCGALDLHWEKPAAMVVRALTEQPYRDWTQPEAVVVNPPPPGPQNPQTVYIGGHGVSAFTAAAFTAQASGVSPARLTLGSGVGGTTCPAPYQSLSCRYVGVAVPVAVTVNSILRTGVVSQEWCGSVIPDCSNATAITIGGNPYQYLQAGPYFDFSNVILLVRWTE